MNNAREQLDRLFTYDAATSVIFGAIALLAPHGVLTLLTGVEYNHSVHETLRLYGCQRVACGWILYNIRFVDDGKFRKHVCEALCFCYTLQALAILRAQTTDKSGSHIMLDMIAIFIMSILALAYGSFRFRKGGQLIKVYELPSASTLH